MRSYTVRLVSIILIFFSFNINCKSQLPYGSVAPDFTLTDINGNEWNLYEQLDKNKYIIIDFMTQWCGPCWNFHEKGVFKELYEKHGPDGSGKLLIFMVELSNASIDCLNGGNNCENWLETIDYPVFITNEITTKYDVNYYPTMYLICPDSKTLSTFNTGASLVSLEDEMEECPRLLYEQDLDIYSLPHDLDSFCDSLSVTPKMSLLNHGILPVENFKAMLYLNDTLIEEKYVETFIDDRELHRFDFKKFTIYSDAKYTIELLEVNNEINLSSKKSISKSYAKAKEIEVDTIFLNLRNDSLSRFFNWSVYNYQPYWFDDVIFYNYEGGGLKKEGVYLKNFENVPDSNYLYSLPISTEGCLRASYSSFSNSDSNAILDLYTNKGDTLFSKNKNSESSIGTFKVSKVEKRPTHSAFISDFIDPNFNYCSDGIGEIEIIISNVGIDTIKSMGFNITYDGVFSEYVNITTQILPGQENQEVILPFIRKYNNGMLGVKLDSINQEENSLTFQSEFEVILNSQDLNSSTFKLNIQFKEHAKNYAWEIVDSRKVRLFSGGNKKVLENYFEEIILSPLDSGAYSNFEIVNQTISLDSLENGCYRFLFYIGGDNNNYIPSKLAPLLWIENDATEIYRKDFTNFWKNKDVLNFELDIEIINNTKKDKERTYVSYYPNPFSRTIYMEGDLTEVDLVRIFSSDGNEIYTVMDITDGAIDFNPSNDGLYIIQFVFNDGTSQTQKIIKNE